MNKPRLQEKTTLQAYSSYDAPLQIL